MSDYKPRIKLKDIRVSWVSGELHRNGEIRTEEQVRQSLINKHLMVNGGKEGFRPLTNEEIQDIIYKDPSRYRQKLSPDDDMKVKMKKLELEAKVLDMRLLKEEYKIKSIEYAKKREKAEQLTRKLMEESTPNMFNLEVYQRMNPQFCALAIQSMYSELSEKQCRLIIGSWVRKGY